MNTTFNNLSFAKIFCFLNAIILTGILFASFFLVQPFGFLAHSLFTSTVLLLVVIPFLYAFDIYFALPKIIIALLEMIGAFLILQQFFFGFLSNGVLEIYKLDLLEVISVVVVLFFIIMASFYFIKYFWFLKKKNGFLF